LRNDGIDWMCSMTKSKKTILSITAKCSDMYSHSLQKRDGTTIDYDGYVPSFMPGEHFGDYVMLDIDPYTGLILNWKKWKRAKTTKLKDKTK
jgi:hypothetical protein